MDKNINHSISIEKMAAYLDANLPEIEMENIQATINNNDFLGNMMNELTCIDNMDADALSSPVPLELYIPDSLPTLDAMNETTLIDTELVDDLFFYQDNNLTDAIVSEDHSLNDADDYTY